MPSACAAFPMHLVTGKHQPLRNRDQPRSLLGCCILLQRTIPKLNKHACINDAPLQQDAPLAHTPSFFLSFFLSFARSLSIYVSIQPMSSSRRLARAHKKRGGCERKGSRNALRRAKRRAARAAVRLGDATSARPPLLREQISAESSGANALNGTGASRPAVERNPSKAACRRRVVARSKMAEKDLCLYAARHQLMEKRLTGHRGRPLTR